MKNPFGIKAEIACKGACNSSCYQQSPQEEPWYGVRVDGHAEWGNAKGTYFLVYEGWPTQAWKNLGFPMDTTNNGDKNVLDVQQFRGSREESPFRKGPIQIWKYHGRIFGRWKEGGRPSDWLEGDVILPFGEDWESWEASHSKPKRSIPYETLAPVTSPPTNAPITPRSYGFIVQAVEGSQSSFVIPSQERQYWNKNAQSKHGNTFYFRRCSNGENIDVCAIIFDRNTWTGQSPDCTFLTGDVLVGYVVGWTCKGAVQSTAVSEAPTKTPTKTPTKAPTKAPTNGDKFYTVGKDSEDCNAACEAIGKKCDRSSIKTTTEEEFRDKLRLAEVPFVGRILDFRSPSATCPLLVDGELWVLNAESGNPTCSGGGRGYERLCTCK